MESKRANLMQLPRLESRSIHFNRAVTTAAEMPVILNVLRRTPQAAR